MADTGLGRTRIEKNRRFESYQSAKQHYSDRIITEYIWGGTGATGAGIELSFTSDTIDYPAAEDQVYIRTEADDTAANTGKYVYIEYYDDDGIIRTANAVHAADTSDEVILTGADDFFRLRRMWTEVISLAAGGRCHQLTDDDLDAATHYAFIEDGESEWAAERYFVPSATQVEHSYLGRLEVIYPFMAAAATAVDAIILVVTYTPKVLADIDGDDSAPMTKVITLPFSGPTVWEPMLELQPATEVIFTWADTTTAQTIKFEATMLEVWLTNSNPSS